MENFYSLLLTFLELTFVFVSLILLYSQRPTIGRAPFYLVLGTLLLFGQMLSATGLSFNDGTSGWFRMDFPLGEIVIFMPFMAAILMTYVTDGALATQRLIIGSLVAMGVFFYLCDLTRLQARWITFAISSSTPLESLDFLLERSRRIMLAVVLGQILEMFLMPIVFSRLRTRGRRLFFCCAGALLAAMVGESLLFQLLTAPEAAQWGRKLLSALAVKAGVCLYLAGLLSLYVVHFGEEREAKHSRVFEIVIAFFGGYGRSKLLEANLLEWEGRYRMVLEHASEMIVILDAEGKVLDANPAAERLLQMPRKKLLNFPLAEQCFEQNGEPFLPDYRAFTADTAVNREHPYHGDVVIRRPERDLHLAISVTSVAMGGIAAFILMGRDTTDAFEFAQEKQRLNDELAHSQRLEALGQLAGGIAHDFNNNIHAILGNADLLSMDETLSERSRRHLQRILDIAVQSGKLTSQLLGFARKGNFRESEFDLRIPLQKSLAVFRPGHQDVEIEVSVPEQPLLIRGDQVQLQQVFVNLLLNARDAMQSRPEGEKKITIRLSGADAAPLPSAFSEQGSLPLNHYCLLSFTDTGCGMDETTRKRLFEPFFTTKPIGVGTGMGLAMAYGTVTNHKGWIAVESTPGTGTSFHLLLPQSAALADVQA